MLICLHHLPPGKTHISLIYFLQYDIYIQITMSFCIYFLIIFIPFSFRNFFLTTIIQFAISVEENDNVSINNRLQQMGNGGIERNVQ